MSTLSQFAGGSSGIKPNGLMNGTGAISSITVRNTLIFNSAAGNWVSVLSGACTANTLKTVLSLSGKGCISFFAAGRKVGGNSVQRLKMTIDGVVVVDGSVLISSSQDMAVALGSPTTSYDATYALLCPSVITEPLNFDQSLLLEYAQDVTGTNESYLFYKYTPRA